MVETREGDGLVRGLGFVPASAVVVGTVIGSGIFIGANRVAAGVSGVWETFAIWIGAGLLTLLGALTYAEFGAALPRSGGDYVYARRSLGAGWGFVTGWITFFINLPASIGALALAFADQLETLKPLAHGAFTAQGFAVKFTAVALIAIFTIINYLGVRQAGLAQTVVTVLKLALIAGVVAVGLSGFADGADNLVPFFGAQRAAPLGGFALAMVGALWAYDGWSGVTRVAAEVKDPGRNLPKALILGILTVIGVYVLIYVAYLVILGLDGTAGTGMDEGTANLVASRAAEAVLGAPGRIFVAVMIMVSILGPLNGLTLSGPRVYYAMARDRLFPAILARVHPTHRTPHVSIVFQGAISAVLVLFFTFDILTAYVVLAAWLQYAITAVGLLVLRRKEPGLRRPYKVPLYPVVPILFVVLSVGFILWLVVDSFLNIGEDPANFGYTMLNVLVILAAWPVWWGLSRRRRALATAS